MPADTYTKLEYWLAFIVCVLVLWLVYLAMYWLKHYARYVYRLGLEVERRKHL